MGGVGNQKDSLGQISMDTNHDGSADLVLVDVNGDGNVDTIGLDTNGDGKIDTYRKWDVGVPDIKEGSLAAILKKKKSKQTLAQQRKIALTDLFYVIDKHGDGSIEEDELSEFLENVFPPSKNSQLQAQMIKLMIEGLDVDGDGTVSLDEFIDMMEPVVQRAENIESPESVSRRIFKVLDAEGDGIVTTGEFSRF